ncbi:Gluconate transport-inducing protein [Taxawa tesnikishii (nom. ined.)]|nr:Gluconate transport-inducing protein [Dothideales sp. JES 119]
METYNGQVRTPADAIILFEACRIGLLPRVQRRLSEKERQSIKSGSVFVWDEREAGMRRWTDGKSWSASRVSGSFLTYREMEGKRGGSNFSAPSKNNRDGFRGLDQDAGDEGVEGYRYKPDGLMKQSFSITTSTGQHLHLISYFARSAATSQTLMQPSNDPSLRHIRPEKGMYPESTVHEQNNIPAVTRGPMTSPAFAPSPHQSANIGSPYGRPPPGQPPHPAGYGPPGWAPPSPMHTPPPHYAPYYHPNSQPNGIGHSSLYQMHGAYPPHPHNYPPSLTAFDRAPPPLSNASALPPPHPQRVHMPPMQTGHVNGYTSQPPYPPHPQQHQQQLPPRPDYQQKQHQQSNGPPIDPKLFSPPAPNVDARQDSAQPLRNGDATAGAQSKGDGEQKPATSTATTIPSISSLINDAPAAADQRARTGSRSPNSAQPRHTQDIPVHKLAYDVHRDAQALRNLDKTGLRF